ncbi:MAG: hypothetical protein Q9188_000539 [Gyalolechia gomerana]
MPTIWRLQIPLRNKISLSLIFGLGSLICIISVVRLHALSLYTSVPTMASRNRDGTYNNNLPILYTVLESSLGVICACVIIMKPLFSKSRLLRMMTRKSSAITDPKASNANRRRASVAVNGANASWELALQRSRFQDMQILKQYEGQGLDLDLEAATMENAEHLQPVAESKKGGMIDVRPVNEKADSITALSPDTEMEIQRHVA